MAGLGRRTHYRKHLTQSVLYEYPEPSSTERIAKVVATRGSNQFDIILPIDHHSHNLTKKTAEKKKQRDDGDADVDDNRSESHLAILPTKFRKLVWVKRNDYVIVETGQSSTDDNDETNGGDDDGGGGIRYIISHILYKDQVKHLKAQGLWPEHDSEFARVVEDNATVEDVDDDGDTSPRDDVANDDDGIDNYEKDDDDGIVYDNDDDLFVNTNRVAALKVDDDESSSDEDD